MYSKGAPTGTYNSDGVTERCLADRACTRTHVRGDALVHSSDGGMPKKEGQEGSGVFVPSPAANAVLTALFGAEVLGALYALNAGVVQARCRARLPNLCARRRDPPAYLVAAQARYRRTPRLSRGCALSRSSWRAC